MESREEFEKLPNNLKEEINTEKRIKELIDDKKNELIFEHLKGEYVNIFISPPRFFPSSEWFGVALKSNFWIPFTACSQDYKWTDIKISDDVKLTGLPISGTYIDEFKYDEERLKYRSDIGARPNMNMFFKYWTRKLRRCLGKNPYIDEAVEILKIQLNLSLEEYYSSSTPQEPDEFGQIFRIKPVVSNTLIKATNRVGTGIVEALSSWPLILYPETISTTISTETDIINYRYHESPISCPNTIESMVTLLVKPILYYIKSQYTGKYKINIMADGACIGHPEIMLLGKNITDEFLPENFCVVDSPFHNKISVLNDISIHSMSLLSEKCKEKIKGSALDNYFKECYEQKNYPADTRGVALKTILVDTPEISVTEKKASISLDLNQLKEKLSETKHQSKE